MHADDSELDEVRKGGTTGTASFFFWVSKIREFVRFMSPPKTSTTNRWIIYIFK